MDSSIKRCHRFIYDYDFSTVQQSHFPAITDNLLAGFMSLIVHYLMVVIFIELCFNAVLSVTF